MSKVVFRVAKLRSQGDVGTALVHNERRPGFDASKSWSHVDLSRSHLNPVLVAPEPVPVAEIVRRKTGKSPRKNAVLATEILIGASPDYFRPKNPAAAGTWDPDRLQAWRDAVEPWIAERFPHAHSVVLHLDESTPHYQVIDIPLVEGADGSLRLAHKVKYGGEKRRDMERWQTWAAEPVAHLGIERGLRGSTAIHTPVFAFRGDQVRPGPIRVEPPPVMLTQQSRADWAARETAKVRASIGPVVQSATGRKVAERKAAEAARKGAIARERVRHLEAERDELQRQLKAERDRLREIPLRRILEDWGFEEDPADPKYQWRTPGHRISIERGHDQQGGMKWYDHERDHGGGGAFDLVMHIDQCDFHEALRKLKARYGEDATLASWIPEAKKVLRETEPPAPYEHPEPAPDAAPALERWLVEVRGIGKKIAQRVIERGLVYATRVGRHINAAFPGAESAELRGIGEGSDFRGMAPGSKKDSGGWWTIAGGRRGTDPAKQVVITESAIDAISYAELHRTGVKRLLASTAGARSRAPWIEGLVRQHDPEEVVVAFDADVAGDRAADRLIQRFLELGVPASRHRPEGGKDWNQVLKRQKGLEPPADPLPELDQVPTSGPKLG